ncbi:hypothetical protein COBT_002247, partial [Conglomerata obtusa]
MRPTNLTTPTKYNYNEAEKENLDPITVKFPRLSFSKNTRRVVLGDKTSKLGDGADDEVSRMFEKLTDSPVKKKNLRE